MAILSISTLDEACWCLNRAPRCFNPVLYGWLETWRYLKLKSWQQNGVGIRHVTSGTWRLRLPVWRFDQVMPTDTDEKKHNVMQLNLFNFLALRTPDDPTECVATYSSRTQPPIIRMPQLQPSCSAALVPKITPLKSGMKVQVSLETTVEPHFIPIAPHQAHTVKLSQCDSSWASIEFSVTWISEHNELFRTDHPKLDDLRFVFWNNYFQSSHW